MEIAFCVASLQCSRHILLLHWEVTHNRDLECDKARPLRFETAWFDPNGSTQNGYGVLDLDEGGHTNQEIWGAFKHSEIRPWGFGKVNQVVKGVSST